MWVLANLIARSNYHDPPLWFGRKRWERIRGDRETKPPEQVVLSWGVKTQFDSEFSIRNGEGYLELDDRIMGLVRLGYDTPAAAPRLIHGLDLIVSYLLRVIGRDPAPGTLGLNLKICKQEVPIASSTRSTTG